MLGCDHWALAGPPWSKTVGLCDILGTLYALVSRIVSVTADLHTQDIPNEEFTEFINYFIEHLQYMRDDELR